MNVFVVGALALLALVVAVASHARSESFCPDRPGGTATADVSSERRVGYRLTVHTLLREDIFAGF